MARIGMCVFFLLKFSVAVCILLVKKLEKGINITTKSGSLRNSTQKCGKILRVRKDTLAPVVSTLRGQAPPSPPPFRRLCLRGHARTCSVSGRSHMRALPPGTLCPTTSAPWLILSSSGNCWNHTILVTLLISVDFFVFFVFWAFGWLL